MLCAEHGINLTIKENTENGAMDDYCSKVKAFYFNTVWGE